MVIWLSSCLVEEAGLKPTSPEFDLSARQYSYISQLLFFCLDIADRYACPHILSGKSNFFKTAVLIKQGCAVALMQILQPKSHPHFIP